MDKLGAVSRPTPRALPVTASFAVIDAGNPALADALRAALADAGLHGDDADAATPNLSDTLYILTLGADADLAAVQARLQVSSPAVMAVAATATQASALLESAPGIAEVSLATDPAFVLVARARRCARGARTHLPERDPLTGALSRAPFVRAFDDAVQQLGDDVTTALLYVDIDNFKTINDRHGHAAGDAVLRGVAQAAARENAPQDQLARIGGDEFAALMTRYDRESVLRDCRRLLDRIARYEAHFGGDGVRVTVSAGLTFVEPNESFDTAIRRADESMYEAKRRGRQGLVVHDGGAVAARDPDAPLRHFENVTRVASERVAALISVMGRRLLEAARAEAHRDSLTGLLNRRHFDAQMPREVDRARQNGLPLAVALMDVDHFHDVNMTYGWVGGDSVLRRFAEVVANNVRLTDWAARYGGEEFVLVMPGLERAAALDVAERIRYAFAQARIASPDGREMHATVSIGVVRWDASSADSLALMHRASEALLRAKHGGRNRVAT